MTNEEAHRIARERGVSKPLYAFVRLLLAPFLRLYFRMHIEGAEHIPASGAAIVAPNHKSFSDSFFIALATRRHLRYMGKSELFRGPWARLLVAVGAFPVRRGESDADALETSREVLRQGGLLALFPEGTRIRDPEHLGEPHRGTGRLALETGAPIVPCAIAGTDHLWLGPVLKPKRVQVAFAPAIEVSELAPTPEAAGKVIEGMVWPQVETRFHDLRSRPGLIAAGLAALGLGGALAFRRRRGPAARGAGRKKARSRARGWRRRR